MECCFKAKIKMENNLPHTKWLFSWEKNSIRKLHQVTNKQKKKRKSAYIGFKDEVIPDHEKQSHIKMPWKEIIQVEIAPYSVVEALAFTSPKMYLPSLPGILFHSLVDLSVEMFFPTLSSPFCISSHHSQLISPYHT